MLYSPHTAYTFKHGLKKMPTNYISLYFSLSKQSKWIKNLFKEHTTMNLHDQIVQLLAPVNHKGQFTPP